MGINHGVGGMSLTFNDGRGLNCWKPPNAIRWIADARLF
jgi:hypothetical protein